MILNYFCIDSNSIMSYVFIASFQYSFDDSSKYLSLCLIRYLSPTDWHCCDIIFFINLLSKTKSYLALFLSFLIFCFGVQFFFYLSVFHLLFFFCQNRFSSHTSNETSFLVSLHCLSVKIFFKLFSKLSIFFTHLHQTFYLY